MDLINFNLLQFRSQDVEVTGQVKNIWYAIKILASYKLFKNTF